MDLPAAYKERKVQLMTDPLPLSLLLSGSSHEESSTVSVSSTSKVVIIYGTQRPNLDPTSYYTTPTTEATSYRKHPSIQTFTVGNDGRFMQ